MKTKNSLIILILSVFLVSILINTAYGHGTHMPGTSDPIIGSKPIGFGQIVWYLDLNRNDRPDHVWVVVFVKNNKHLNGVVHIIFNDTYPKFLREYGEEHRW